MIVSVVQAPVSLAVAVSFASHRIKRDFASFARSQPASRFYRTACVYADTCCCALSAKLLNHAFCFPHFSFVHPGHRKPSCAETVLPDLMWAAAMSARARMK